jgi:hypothetical protein
MKLPGEDDAGLYSDGHGRTHQQIADYTETYIESSVGKVFFPTLLLEWLEFTLDKTTAFDEAMAAGYTLIAARNKIYKRTVSSTRDVSRYFKKHKVPAA